MKFCPTCEYTKELSEFCKNKYRKDGLARECSSCARSRMKLWRKNNPDRHMNQELRAKYNISLDQYHDLLFEQHGLCGICAEPMDRPHVDHCHNTGIIRGLLCRDCNSGLGLFRDSTDLLQSAIQYLEESY